LNNPAATMIQGASDIYGVPFTLAGIFWAETLPDRCSLFSRNLAGLHFLSDEALQIFCLADVKLFLCTG
jgi:hypothetical protein